MFSKRDLIPSEKYPEGTIFQRMKIGTGEQKVFDSSKTDKNQNLVKLKIEKKSNIIVKLLGFYVPAHLPPSEVGST